MMTDSRSNGPLPPELSTYLDIWRSIAAILVVLFHLNREQFSHYTIPLAQFGHEAVVIFFFISGIVIASVASSRDFTLKLFLAHRFSRLYGVLVPALACTTLVGAFLLAVMPSMLTEHAFALPVFDFLLTILFLNESWFLSVSYLDNAPLWSLSYEVAFYAMFASCFFLVGFSRLLGIVICIALFGPKIFLLAPIWALGAVVYFYFVNSRFSDRLPQGLAWAICILSLFTIHLFLFAGLNWRLAWRLREAIGAPTFELLGYSKLFIGDWILGALVSLHFATFYVIRHHFGSHLRKIDRLSKYLATISFPIYVIHWPLLTFTASIVSEQFRGGLTFILVYLCTLFASSHALLHLSTRLTATFRSQFERAATLR